MAGLLFPLAGGFGVVSNRAASTVENVSSELLDGTVPAVTTMTDATGDPIAYIYDQRRFPVGYDDIAPDMIRAIISIEDRRFLQHDGVDWKGTIRAALKNSSSGEVQQGASTLDQQYIKNYQLLVLARTEADRQAAVADTPARKLREVRMALTMEKSLEDQAQRDENLSHAQAKQEAKKVIVSRYLNIVPFGNGAYGVEAAARTYFNKHAKDLTVGEAAMLAGMVQSSSALDPYTNSQAVIARRNTVLDKMIENFPARTAELTAAKNAPLGVIPEPQTLPQGCIAAKGAGYFCDYALQYLSDAGLSSDQISRGGYTIRTTLDPRVQNSVQKAAQSVAGPHLDGIANVINILRPYSKDHPSHDLLAMVSSRNYGLNQGNDETVQPEPFSMVGDGAGSIFKIFTTAAAMEKGMGISATLQVPPTLAVKGMGSSDGAYGCPPDYYCVKNAGNYAPAMSVTQALATSPNTAFVKLIQQTGVPAAVDMAVRLGMRSYAKAGTAGDGDMSLADYFKKYNLGSFTLGPTAVNALELSNVAATLSSHGMWCPPNPIISITQPKRDRFGNIVNGPDGKPVVGATVPVNSPKCEQVIDPALADTLANALSKDDQAGGTSAGSAGAVGWNLPLSAKTGTTETHRSSAFLAFTNNLAGASYIYGDSTTPSGICTSPLRQCGEGNLYGGLEPARAWYAGVLPVANSFGPTALPPTTPRYVNGGANAQVPDVNGMTVDDATAKIRAAGFKVETNTVQGSAAAGTVVSTSPSTSAIPGATITLNVSDGSTAPRSTAPTPPTLPNLLPGGGTSPPTTIQIPGVGPIVIPGN
ncbi:penicillin-binding protein [Gordonia jinhuaensis]|uniref:Bifunctional membrane-associated penicillin-binding protein PonA2/glycosyl transferase n=1 Tax=Gordonia jinhuaensis TaxID=1517702 RepID=A0A916WVB4_9ACTN|nr:transglycosylase domain-containing protein [Gordonia jinhuaensis]GGB35537.1 putative bifunctional membrane-associated penicillin-binding protein PonA2/glycosyl transferase [Gordonia jinhuaensis]